METSNSFVLFFTVCLVLLNIIFVNGYISNVQNDKSNRITWCTLNVEEQMKCLNLSAAVNRDKYKFDSRDFMELFCKQGVNKDDCMMLLDINSADILSLDAGEVFVGGRYNSLIPLMQQLFENDSTKYYSVALIKKNTLKDVYNLRHLKGKKACFAGVGTQAGWNIPINTLISKNYMEIIDCNNHVKSTINFFGPSCAVNSLLDKYNPMGDNSDSLCTICASKVSGQKCTWNDPYAGDEGAFKCLIEKGDIAFLRHTTMLEIINDQSSPTRTKEDDLELLCVDGSRRPISEFNRCNWGTAPTDAIVTTSAKTSADRMSYQKWLQKIIELYGKPKSSKSFASITSDDWQRPPINNNLSFYLFDSTAYGDRLNLLLQDSTRDVRPLEESQQTYSRYLGDSMDIILGVRYCPATRMILCVTSEPELEKCIKMKMALKVQLLTPELQCYRGYSQVNCMQAIQNGNADVAVMDAGDIYTAGLVYNQVPFITEMYDLPEPEYYIVAVAKEEDPDTELTYLKGKMTCHPGVYSGGGWIIPMAFLLSNGWIRSYGCDSLHAASEYFSKSCVPGALSNEYNNGLPYDNLCHLCRGSSYRYCKRDATEDFYGYTGALRCLVEGGGNVAFVKHTTVYENADGKRKQWWARNTLSYDFELLCPDGTRSSIADYKKCSLGKVKANAVITRGGDVYNETEVMAFTNLFMAAQQLYGRKTIDEFTFSMFTSPEPYSDLIFQDATQQLVPIDSSLRYYSNWLGSNFMRARRLVDCQAAGTALLPISIMTMVSSLLCFHMWF
ncbi:Transferrin,Transferrin family, iron binding site,Transferrin-like domain [Cinara cedri]|uniref:Transferrin,Transferrin family, iron binding site,Transferrin-like domain n=1 Tax=Cinara cedri TaxID=506608 RepID=A0A5E4NHF4_9HEMI|nr:Transferrin,Transferrin family, iron binding site,Transferrin-like domain [Cinara cedri]